MRNRPPKGEVGSVTAELAIALPSVMLLAAIILGVGQWQIQQQRLLVGAATIARALARSESQALIDEWVSRLPARLKVSYADTLVCATLTQDLNFVAFEKLGNLQVSEQQCAQKQ
jgi:Flp pilus assembly protein TadG